MNVIIGVDGIHWRAAKWVELEVEMKISPRPWLLTRLPPHISPQMQICQSTVVGLSLPYPLSSWCLGGSQVACVSLLLLFPPLLAASVVRPVHKAITSKEKGKSRPGELCLDPLCEGVCHCHKYRFADTAEKPLQLLLLLELRTKSFILRPVPPTQTHDREASLPQDL